MTASSEISVETEQPKIPWQVWSILFISSFGVFMASVSTSALVIAFPVLLIDLNMTINNMMWVLLVLLLLLGAIVPTAGKLGDIFGQSKIYLVGYWTFVLGSLGAGFVQKANEGYDLIAARVVIGFGAALLFTNSSAILTNAFAPYGKVGLSQGIFQLFSAMGIVFGPLIGGGFAETNWRWIFWFNVPTGGLLAALASFILLNKEKLQNKNQVPYQSMKQTTNKSFYDQVKTFDFIGAISCSAGLVLILIALIQGVVTDPVLSSTKALIGLIASGCVCGAIFIIDQFYASDPLIPPQIFYNRIFSLCTIAGTSMAFVRNSITYNMIFFLQGPLHMDPLQAGIALIPFGIGIMVAGFIAGAIADRVGVRKMIALGPLVTMAGVVCLLVMNQYTSEAYIGGILFVCGLGVGIFQSPNSASSMLSVTPERRGVAAAVGMLTMSFTMMLGIVITFSFVLHSMTADELFELFIYGSNNIANFPMNDVLNALAKDYYIVIACCLTASCTALFLPNDLNDLLKKKKPIPPSPASSSPTKNESDILPTPAVSEYHITANNSYDIKEIDVDVEKGDKSLRQ